LGAILHHSRLVSHGHTRSNKTEVMPMGRKVKPAKKATKLQAKEEGQATVWPMGRRGDLIISEWHDGEVTLKIQEKSNEY
jgi:hypothetical protein